MHRTTRRSLSWLGCAVLLLVAFLWYGLSAAQATSTMVAISDFAFAPATTTIGLNHTLQWENAGAAPHTVTSQGDGWNSGTLNAGQSFTRTFTQTGTFDYFCAIHPQMQGQVRVVLDPTRAETVFLPLVTTRNIAPIGPSGPPITATGTLWSDPASWGGRLPGLGAAVVIPAGIPMTLDTSPPGLYSLRVDGALTFAEKPLNLSANWIMVHGRLQVGTAQQPFRSKATITLTGDNRAEDIMGMGTKFLGAMGGGVIEIHGHRRDAVSWTRLAATAAPGATQVTLAEPVDWRPGDEIVIAPSGFDPLEAEKVTVTAVGGATVSFTPPLAHRHYGEVQQIEGRTLDSRAEVGLLTRDIVIQGDDPGGPTEEFDYYPYQRGFGGHMMIMAGSQARVAGVEFRRMGQTGFKARYPMHWHFTGEGQGQYIKNSSVNGSFHRAIVTHGVSNVLVERNVVYSVASHAFVPAEDGPETGNRFVGNLGVLNFQLNPVDYSFGPDGRGRGQQEERPGMFWLTNPNNPLEGNVAAGTLRGQGFFYDGGRFGAGFSFRDNVAHSVTAAGTGNAEILYPPSTRGYGLFVGSVDRAENDEQSYQFQGLTAYKNGLAGAWLEKRHELLAGSVLADHNLGAILFESTISDTLVIGQSANLTADATQKNFGSGGLLYMTGRGSKLVNLQGVTFVNHAADAPAVVFADESMLAGGQVAGLRFVNTPQRIRFITGEGRQPAYGWFRDVDGSLSGTGALRDVAPQPLDRRTCVAAPSLTAHLCAPPAGSALGLHLRLDEGAGITAADSSPFGSAATLRGGAAWVGGQLGGGVGLDGTSGWVELATQRLQGDFTVALWVRLGADLERQNPILGSAQDGYYRVTFEPYRWGTTDYRGRLQLRNGNVNFGIAAEAAVQPGVWSHVAIVRSGSQVTLYLNGIQVGQGETDELMGFNAFGRHGTSFFGGQLDDLRIYDRVLTAAELQSAMAGGMP